MEICVIAGLGNPGTRYANTRHNIGFKQLDTLAERVEADWTFEKRFEALVTSLPIAGNAVWLLKPQTSVNESGRSIDRFCRYHKINAAEVALVHDDITLPLGELKLTVNGRSGGHNGVESVIHAIGKDFVRFKVGIGGKPGPQIELKDYVLGKLHPEEQEKLSRRQDDFFKGIELLVDKGPVSGMNFINQRLKPLKSKKKIVKTSDAIDYRATFLIDSRRLEQAVTAFTQELKEAVQSAGGEVKKVIHLGTLEFARHSKTTFTNGDFVQIHFSAATVTPMSLHSKFRLNPNVNRILIERESR